MLVCLCHGVSDKKIKALVASGAGDVRTIRAACSAGGDCGKCIYELKKLISDCQKEADEVMAQDTRKLG